MNTQVSTSHLKDKSTWMRLLFMALFAFAYGVAEFVVTAVVIVQILIRLLTGSVNERLLVFGRQLSHYLYQLLLYLTFNSEVKPFPFSPWPDDSDVQARVVDAS